MVTTLAALEAARGTRPAGYVDAILAAGRVDADGVRHHIRAEDLAAIRARFGVAEPPLPGLAAMARNAAEAVGRVVGAVAAGEAVLVPAAEAARREAICRACDRFRVSDARCSLCGCVMPGAIGKWHLAAERCPHTPPRW